METVAATQLRIAQFIAETYPAADLAPGSVLSELLVKLSATVNNQVYNATDNFSQGGSILQAQASTVDTYSPVIDNVASNYLVTRNAGSLSTGLVKVVVSSGGAKYLGDGIQFTQPSSGLLYTSTQAWTVNSQPSSSELMLYAQQDGTFFFLLPITASAAGPQYQVQNGTVMTLVTETDIANVANITAYGNFTTGVAQETDKQMISRMEIGMTNKGMTSQDSILAALSAQYPSIKAISVVGAGDPEMTRDKQNAFGIATFGLGDVYMRSSNGLDTTSFVKSATKIADGQWSMTFDYRDVAGFYDIVSIQPNVSGVSGTATITSQSFGTSYPPSEPSNLINNTTESRYTQYQSCAVVFAYVESPIVATLSTADFLVTVNFQPLVREAQAIVNDRSKRIAGADYLVKAAIPCYVSLMVSLQANTDQVVPVDTIKQAIFDYINNLDFGEPIYSSKIIDICHNYPQVKRVVTPVVMTGIIASPTGALINIENNDTLSISPYIPYGVSDRIVGFFTSYGVSNSGVSVQVV